MSFGDACVNGDIELAKTLQIPDKETLDHLFAYICGIGDLEMAQWLHGVGASIRNIMALIYACDNGHLEIVKWLHSAGANIYAHENMAFIRACEFGHLNVAKLLRSEGVNIYAQDNMAFIRACKYGHLDVARWLYSLEVNISDQNNRAFISACKNNRFKVVEWLIDIHYKYGGYIKSNDYTYYINDIKNLLIDNNLVNPSTLSKNELQYYLARTDNFVPPDFTTPHTDLVVKYRG
jgi:hypothetical protein